MKILDDVEIKTETTFFVERRKISLTTVKSSQFCKTLIIHESRDYLKKKFGDEIFLSTTAKQSQK